MTDYIVYHENGKFEARTVAALSSFNARLIVAGEWGCDITEVYAVRVDA